MDKWAKCAKWLNAFSGLADLAGFHGLVFAKPAKAEEISGQVLVITRRGYAGEKNGQRQVCDWLQQHKYFK